jgi:Zn finger protein HypA/HybF involved in hydrogenase expression
MLKIYGRQPTSQEYANAFRLYEGNESEFLCADCGNVTRIDPKRDPKVCKGRNSTSLHEVSEVVKAECPKCRSGHFNSGKSNGMS